MIDNYQAWVGAGEVLQLVANTDAISRRSLHERRSGAAGVATAARGAEASTSIEIKAGSVIGTEMRTEASASTPAEIGALT